MAGTVTSLVFEDGPGYADFGTFVARARSLDADGAVRLQADGTVLAAYVGVLPGRGLRSDGAVVGLRTSRLAEPVAVDATVALAAVQDRLARSAGLSIRLDVPAVTVQTAWAAMTPPRHGWESVGMLDAQTLIDVARAGIAEVASGAGQASGGHAVADLRWRVWGRLTSTVPPVAAGAAFAAYSLGFISSEMPCMVAAHGRWTRLSSPRGHVLVR
jgi:hypothetical protein